MTTEPTWMSVARKELGQSEIVGERDNPRILEYHTATTLRATDDETPWCASFVNWVLAQSGCQGTNKANARSFLEWGDTLSSPQPGCVVVLKRGAPPQGHVGFLTDHEPEYVWVLGGNQGNQVSVARFSKRDVLGYRMPKGADFDKTMRDLTNAYVEKVKGWQTMLNDCGYNLDVDGALGPSTRGAIKDFQAKHGLDVDGIIGPQTLKALKAASAAGREMRRRLPELHDKAPSLPPPASPGSRWDFIAKLIKAVISLLGRRRGTT